MKFNKQNHFIKMGDSMKNIKGYFYANFENHERVIENE